MDRATSLEVLASLGLEVDSHVAVNVLQKLLTSGSVQREAVVAACNSLGVDEARGKVNGGAASDAANGHDKPMEEVAKPKSEKPPAAQQQSAKTRPHKPQSAKPALAHRTRHVALLFHYDGATYSGFAQNLPPAHSNGGASNSNTNTNFKPSSLPASVTNDNSVERALFAALTKTCLLPSNSTSTSASSSIRQEANYSRAGRTDRGVSAFGQVVALNLKSAVPLGARLPAERNICDGGGDNAEYGREVTEDDLPLTSEAGDGLDCYAPVRVKKTKQKKNKKQKTRDDSTSVPPPQQPQQLQRRTIPELNYVRMLNNVLPPTIRVLGWCPVTPEFSARFSCSDRTYRYHFIRRNLDLPAMNEALQKMVGRHDFRNFCKMNVEQVSNFERVIKSGRIVDPASTSSAAGAGPSCYDTCHFEIIGQAFLWHQIRCIVSVLFMVGQGRESPDIVDHLLDVRTNPGKPSYPMADELPLVLHRCSYGGTDTGSVDRVPFRRSMRDLWRVACDLESRWEEMTLAAARLRDGLDSLKSEAMVSRDDVEAFVAETVEERKKKSRRLPSGAQNRMLTDGKDIGMNADEDLAPMISWDDALSNISMRLGIEPAPEGQREILHIPLMHRSRGTTYEEKVASLKSVQNDASEDTKKRRRERFEENIVQKRKTTEEDAAFYEHMLSQGGR